MCPPGLRSLSLNACSWERVTITPSLAQVLSFESWHLAFFLLRIPGDRIGMAPTNRRISRFLAPMHFFQRVDY